MASSSTSASCHRKSKTGHFQTQIRPQGLKSGQYQIATEDPGLAVDEPVESLGHDLKLPPFLEARRTRARRAVARAAGRKWTERVSSILRLLPRGVRNGRWIRCEVAQVPAIRFDQAFRSKQRRFSRLTRARGYRRQGRKIGPWHAEYARVG
jgi:hypothetical protein